MICLLIILLILGVIVATVSGFAVLLIDPIIAILVVIGLYKLIKTLTSKKK